MPVLRDPVVRVAEKSVSAWEKEPFGDKQEPVAKEKKLVGDQRVLLTR